MEKKELSSPQENSHTPEEMNYSAGALRAAQAIGGIFNIPEDENAENAACISRFTKDVEMRAEIGRIREIAQRMEAVFEGCESACEFGAIRELAEEALRGKP